MIDQLNRVPFGLLLLLSLCLLPAAHAQQSSQNILPSNPIRSMHSNVPPGSDPLMGSLNEEMAVERNIARQRTIVGQSDQLLALAIKLKTDVAKSNSDELSVAVVKEAAEIEKLAKSIKNKMRNGY